MYFVYKMYDDNNNVIYVGRTINLKARMAQHFSVGCENWKSEVRFIKAARCESYYDMCIYELYYIGKLKPKYNKEHMCDENIAVEIPGLMFRDYKELESPRTTVEIDKDRIKRYVKIYGNDDSKINRNVDEYDRAALSDRWYFKNENYDKVEQVIKNANNFNGNLFKDFKNPSISFPKEITFRNYKSKLRGLKKIVNNYEYMDKEEYCKLNKLIYLRSTYGNTMNKKKQDEHGLLHFLTFLSKSAIINNEHVIVYCPSSRIRRLFNEYINDRLEV